MPPIFFLNSAFYFELVMFVKKNTPQFNLTIEEAVKNNTTATLTAAGSVVEGNLTT